MKYSMVAVVLLGIVAAVCVAGIVTILPGYLKSQKGGPVDVPVLVAAKAIPAMRIVESASLTVKRLPSKAAPSNCLSDPTQAIGKVLVAPVIEGQALTKNSFVAEGSGANVAAVLPKGMRAVSVALEDDAGLMTLLYPGSVVDVLTTSRPGNGSAESVARTLLYGVQVLAVQDKTIVSAEGNGGTSSVLRQEAGRRRLVTLMVDGEQAKILQAAIRQGAVSLALRNPLDNTRPVVETVAEPPPPPPVRTFELTILRDGQPEIRKFTLTEPALAQAVVGH